jgi:hypothetical protein
MIQKQKCLFYFVGDVPFKSLEEAQKADLAALVPDASPVLGMCDDPKLRRAEIVGFILANSTAIVDILTTTPTSRLKASKSHGAVRKTRKPKTAPAEGIAK